MNFLERIIGTIVNPDKTMEDIAKEPRWEEALVIVGIYAVLFAIYSYLQTSHIIYEYVGIEMPAGMATITAVTTVVEGLLMPFIFLVIIAVVLHLLAMAFGGSGKFMAVLTAIGYSTLVKIFFVILAILLLTQAPYVTIQYDVNNPFAMLSNMKAFTDNIYVVAGSLVVLVGLIWSCLIGIFGLKHTEKLSFTSAAIVVGVPALIYIAITYGSKLLGFI